MLPLAPATVCLPVAGGDSERPRVWRYDESATPPEWVALDEPPQGSPGGLVCGETEHFSLFAVGSSASRPEVSDRRAVAKAWLARSGRTIAQHVLAGLQERLRAPREAGFEGALAGRGLDTSGAGWRDGRLPARAGTREDEWRDGRDGPARSDDAVTLRDLVTGSAFRVGAGNEDRVRRGVGPRGALVRPRMRISLDGEVTTGTVGADYQRGRWTGGAALRTARRRRLRYRGGPGRGVADRGVPVRGLRGDGPGVGVGRGGLRRRRPPGGAGRGRARPTSA